MAKKTGNDEGSLICDELVEERLEKIRQRAYQLYEARGCDDGHDLEDWQQAEAESEEPKTGASRK